MDANEPFSKKPTTRKKNQRTRIFVLPETAEKIDQTIASLESAFPGINLNRSAFVEWLMNDFFGNLKKSHEKSLLKQFYSEERFLQSALDEIKRRKATGEDYSYQDFVNEHRKKPIRRVVGPEEKIAAKKVEK